MAQEEALPRGALAGGLQRLVNFHLGGAIYTLPGIVAAAGFARALALLLASGLCTLLVYEYLWRSALHLRQGSLARIVSAALGRPAAAFLRLLVVLNALGVIAAYATTIQDVYFASTSTEKPALEVLTTVPGMVFAAVFFAGAGATLLLEARHAGKADWGSLLANAALLLLILGLGRLVLVRGGAQGGVARTPGIFEAAVKYGPNLVFAYSSAEYVLRACDVADDEGALLKSLSDGAVRRRVRAVGGLSVLASTLLYVVTGAFGALAFGGAVQEDVLSNLRPPSAEFAALLAVNALSLLLSFPVFVEALLLALQELLAELPGTARLRGSAWLAPNRPLLASAWLVPLALMLVARLPGLRRMINLVSAATDYYFMFVLPPMAFLLGGAATTGGFAATLLELLALPMALFAAGMGALSFWEALTES